MTDILSMDALRFFDHKPCELALFECFANALLSRHPDAEMRVQKTQISFYEGRMIACVSLTPVRRKAERPERFITVTFGLDRPLDDPRAVPVQVRHNRWTHHVIVGRADEIDGQLMDWIDAGTQFNRASR